MKKKRVERGEKYWHIHLGDFNPCVMWDWEDGSIYADARYENNNYFHTENEANLCASKIELVLNGADVIEMPSEEEINQATYISDSDFEDSQIRGFKSGVEWLQSKIIKI